MAFLPPTSLPKNPSTIAAFSPRSILTPSSSVRLLPRTNASQKLLPAPPAFSISFPGPALPVQRMRSPTIFHRSCAARVLSHIFRSRWASEFRCPDTSPFSAASPTPPSSAPPSSPKSKKRHPSPLLLLPSPQKFAPSRKPPATASPDARSPHEDHAPPSPPIGFHGATSRRERPWRAASLRGRIFAAR